jgi:hypothetical protein
VFKVKARKARSHHHTRIDEEIAQHRAFGPWGRNSASLDSPLKQGLTAPRTYGSVRTAEAGLTASKPVDIAMAPEVAGRLTP